LGLTVADSSAAKNLILDGSVQDIDQTTSKISATLSSGGTVYWHSPDADSFSKASKALGADGLQLSAGNVNTSIIDRDDPLMYGVSREDVLSTSTAAGWDRRMSMQSNAASVSVLPKEIGSAIATTVSSASNGQRGGGGLTVEVKNAGLYLIEIDSSGADDQPAGGFGGFGGFPGFGGGGGTMITTNGVFSSIVTPHGKSYVPVYLKAGKNDVTIGGMSPFGGGRRQPASGYKLYAAQYPAGVTVHLLPGALVSWKSGNGTVVIDGVNWNAKGASATKDIDTLPLCSPILASNLIRPVG